MTRPGVVLVLWLACAFVAWNVIFDRQVASAAFQFAQAQIVRHQLGETPASIHDAFSPQVRAAAWTASLWVAPLVAAGLFAFYVSSRQNA